jgi:putative transposase
VSLWTVAGRLKDVPFTGSPAQLEQLATHKPRESDLIYRDGKWFLGVTIDVPDPDLCEPAGWLGVDLGIVNIATISDGEHMTGRRLTGTADGSSRCGASSKPRKPRARSGC